jgi:hypothetical protein
LIPGAHSDPRNQDIAGHRLGAIGIIPKAQLTTPFLPEERCLFKFPKNAAADLVRFFSTKTEQGRAVKGAKPGAARAAYRRTFNAAMLASHF